MKLWVYVGYLRTTSVCVPISFILLIFQTALFLKSLNGQAIWLMICLREEGCGLRRFVETLDRLRVIKLTFDLHFY